MYVSTKAIVLSKIKYRDYDLIVKCYTEAFGIKSYLIRNALKSKKGKLRAAYFQELSLLNIEANHKDDRSLQYIKELKLNYQYYSLQTNLIKSSIVIFLSEVLSAIIKEEEPNKELYEFLETSFIWFDQTPLDSNFHLIFLTELTKYLGFYPSVENIDLEYFNLQDGSFQNLGGRHCITGDNILVLKKVLGTKFDVDIKLKLTNVQKRSFLNMILNYFKLHLDGFREPKSLEVLNHVFNS